MFSVHTEITHNKFYDYLLILIPYSLDNHSPQILSPFFYLKSQTIAYRSGCTHEYSTDFKYLTT
ncbi:hypothetical protein XBKQ1_350029 [Xenorhabdus bovienii str. kraussei Quebec]|uniref:Uncharacterized protein n=1 Tax=Xenorhabdus bovienii str. kraussei Quebec TaxID=1398203 RepID=A0A077PJZ2_XENBV|nr:hypothetical protein XBKQ1_350029 [Xenorhabdus bovienii str. kraussei Quebec]